MLSALILAMSLAPCPSGPCRDCRCVEQSKCNAATCQPHRPPLTCGCGLCDCVDCGCESPRHVVQFQLQGGACPSCVGGTCPAPQATAAVKTSDPGYAAVYAAVKAGGTAIVTHDGVLHSCYRDSAGVPRMVPLASVQGGCSSGSCGPGSSCGPNGCGTPSRGFFRR